jgi:hypothetical protein
VVYFTARLPLQPRVCLRVGLLIFWASDSVRHIQQLTRSPERLARGPREAILRISWTTRSCNRRGRTLQAARPCFSYHSLASRSPTQTSVTLFITQSAQHGGTEYHNLTHTRSTRFRITATTDEARDSFSTCRRRCTDTDLHIGTADQSEPHQMYILREDPRDCFARWTGTHFRR